MGSRGVRGSKGVRESEGIMGSKGVAVPSVRGRGVSASFSLFLFFFSLLLMYFCLFDSTILIK